MSEAKGQPAGVDLEVLEQLVAEADTGGRHPGGTVGRILLWVAVAWSLFQLWYASPLPFVFGFGILNDTEARAIHLGFALFLTFLAYPALKSSPRDRVPLLDWVLAVARRVCRRLSVSVLRRAFRTAGSADHARSRHRHRWHPVAARGDAPRARPADGDRGLRLHLLHLCRPVHAGRDPASRRLAHQVPQPSMADDRGRVRHRARRVDELRLSLRAVRHASGKGRRRQLDDADLHRAARPSARRPGESRRGLVGSQRRRVRLVRLQRGFRRHLHHPADEAHRPFRASRRAPSRPRPRSTARSCRRSWARPPS